MNNKKLYRLRQNPLLMWLGVCLIVGVILSYTLYQSLPAVQSHKNTQEYINKHKLGFKQLFTTVFDNAKNCMQTKSMDDITKAMPLVKKTIETCEEKNKQSIYKLIQDDGTLYSFGSTYFIRPVDGKTIEKLFLSGKFVETSITNEKQQKVVNVLQGNYFLFSPLWLDEANLFGVHYFNDLYSEGEVIIPVVIDHHSYGAVVRVWGT